MAENSTPAQSEWLAMGDEEFEEIRAKAELVLRTLPTILEKAEAEARATLALEDKQTIESLSRKRIAEQLMQCAKGRLDQATTTRGLVAMLDSTWRCLAEVRRAYRASLAGEDAVAPQEGTEDGG
jgi:hypothetical protein